ncbi:MAG: hypothetical protein Q8N63_04440 [Nanoarchaeota archaeon]|nr:hypothetical protein [Nanoarchaeota archaeon]
MKNKKGELTSKQLITIIILIISFTIIIAFFVMLGLRAIISNESCRNSVMLRGTFSNVPVIGKDLINLKCKTEDICFSMGGECSDKTDKIIEIANENELNKELIDLQTNCGWMMGEGKVDYGNKGDCAICYKLYFDEKIKNDIRIITPNRQINTNGVYVVVTGTNNKGNYLPPNLVNFSTEELKKFGCSNFITEV